MIVMVRGFLYWGKIMRNMKVIAIYPGRFQPMGQHHKMTYEWMVATFGRDNSFIVTSDKVSSPNSPLNYEEKKAVAIAHGVPNDKFVLTKSPYQPKELFQKLQAERGIFAQDVVVVFVVGKKDMSENPRFTIGFKKSGGPTYYQDYENSEVHAPADQHGYLLVAPHINFTLPGDVESSGTNLRHLLSIADPEVFERAMGFYDQALDSAFKEKFVQAILEAKERGELVLGTSDYSEYIDELIQDIMHVKKSLRSRKNRGSRKESSRLQGAVDSLRFIGKKNERQLNANSLDENVVNFVASNNKVKIKNKQKESLTRDEIKSYFDRLKR